MQQKNEHKIHWLSKDKLMKQKEGVLGFQDLNGFSLTMLERQGWRLIQYPDYLCAQILKAKYFPDSKVLKAKPKEGTSYTWRSILKGTQLLRQGVVWRIGDGSKVQIWSDARGFQGNTLAILLH